MSAHCEKKIGWVNGSWGPIDQLKVPILDRGLTLGDGIFETVLILNGKVRLLAEHCQRWRQSALLLAMDEPPTESELKPLINEGINRASLDKEDGVIRLNWSRGDSSKRGINLPIEKKTGLQHRFWLEINPHKPQFEPQTTMISRYEQRNPYSLLSLCKTFAYGQAIQARREAQQAGFDEALLLNTKGEICCGTTSNLLIRRKNKWLTPYLKSGCLPGVMRQKGIDSGLFHEASLSPRPEEGDQWLLINSLQCHPLSKINNEPIQVFTNPQALWLSLLTENSY